MNTQKEHIVHFHTTDGKLAATAVAINDGAVVRVGFSVVHSRDTGSKKRGRNIARDRALKSGIIKDTNDISNLSSRVSIGKLINSDDVSVFGNSKNVRALEKLQRIALDDVVKVCQW